jgi:hypothetical protein
VNAAHPHPGGHLVAFGDQLLDGEAVVLLAEDDLVVVDEPGAR